jgi:hypothetical protein
LATEGRKLNRTRLEEVRKWSRIRLEEAMKLSGTRLQICGEAWLQLAKVPLTKIQKFAKVPFTKIQNLLRCLLQRSKCELEM